QTRDRARRILQEAQKQGIQAVHIDGEGDIADVCRLTCLEQGLKLLDENEGRHATLRIQGKSIELLEPGEH
ncbi:MAG: hypothetical protein PVF49_09400, partial [Anaerolineales bacterium]